MRNSESLLVRLDVGNSRVSVDRWGLGWQRLTTRSARVRLIWSSLLLLLQLPLQVERSNPLLTSRASAVCVTVVINLHDV